MSETLLIVGLGNPGREYQHNRHNIGFMLLDALAGKLDTRFNKVQLNALITFGILGVNKLILAKPQTYMNLSGQAVASLLRYYKIPLSNFIVANDDVDLPLGTIRIRPSGGSGGQKGVGSIIEILGTQDYPRLRMGIGRPPGQMEVADYVLQDFSKGEMEIVEEMINRAVEAILLFSENGLNAAMNKFNGQIPDE